MSSPCTRPECGGEVHTDPWGTPVQCPHQATGPIRLTVDELVPVLAALERRSRQLQAGHKVLLCPLPRCPSCGAPPDEMTTAPSPDFMTDTVAIQFERCGHSFTADGDVVEEAAGKARQIVDHLEQQPVDGQTPPEPPKPAEFVMALREDDGTLIVGIHPNGQITTGPRYQPDAAAREFWDAITRAAQAANPWEAP